MRKGGRNIKQNCQSGYARYEIQPGVFSERVGENWASVYESAYQSLFGIETLQEARVYRDELQKDHDKERYCRLGEKHGPRYELFEYIDGEFILMPTEEELETVRSQIYDDIYVGPKEGDVFGYCEVGVDETDGEIVFCPWRIIELVSDEYWTREPIFNVPWGDAILRRGQHYEIAVKYIRRI